MKLELGIIAGSESKAWLADLTKVVERMERAANILKVGTTSTEATLEATTSDDAPEETDEEDFGTKTTERATKKTAKKTAASFDEEDEQDEEEITAQDREEDSETEEEEDEEPTAKKAKAAKKVTLDDVNDACKARALATGGKRGRSEVLAILKKKFDTETVSKLKPEQYAAAIKAMAL